MIAPAFNATHLERACAAGAAPLVFDAETLLAAQARGAAPLTPRDVLGSHASELPRLFRESIDVFAAFAADVPPLSAVLYRHARWIARALVPACVTARAGELAPTARHVRATHLLDGRSPELTEETLLAMALGAAGAPIAITPDLPPPPAPARPSPPADHEPCTLLIAGPVEAGFMTRIAEAWNTGGDGTRALLITKERETDLLGELAPPEAPAIDWRPLVASSSHELCSLLWTNPGLEPHLLFLGTTYAAAMRRQIARWTRLLESGRIARVVAAYPCVALDVAASLGVPSVLLPHGPMVTAEDDLYRLTPADRIGAISEAHAHRLRSRGLESATVTGLPSVQPPVADPAPACDVLLLSVEPARPRDAGSLPRIWPNREINAMRALAGAAERRGWRVRLRRHPRYDRSIEFYRALFGSSLELSPPGRPLAADAQNAGLLLTFSGPSSVILDATRLGAPVVIATESWAYATPGDWGLGGWPVARNGEELERLIARSLSTPDAREALRRQSETALRAFDGSEIDPLAATLDLLASAQPRATSRTMRDERSTTVARG